MAELPGAGELEPDVVSALAALDMEPVAASPVGGFPRWRDRRTTWRIELADGRAVKVRRNRRLTRGERSAALATALRDAALPPPLAVRGRLTVEAWVEGRPLDAAAPATATVREAGDLLGRLHAVRLLPGHRFRAQGRPTAVLTRVRRDLEELVAAAVLGAAEGRALTALVEGGLPEHAPRGVIHGDLCAENLVITPEGRLVSVDHEGLRVDFLHYDLARTWWRWPMPPERWRELERRYEAWGHRLPDASARRAWRVAALAKSAHRRARSGARGAGEPAVAGLRRLLEG